MSRRRKPATPPRPWQPLAPATPRPVSAEERELQIASAMETMGRSRDEAKALIDELHRQTAAEDCYMNDRYLVFVKRHDNGSAHVSLRRLDRGHVRDWRDLQRIKNEVLGPEVEAVELFPAESRLVDSANQFHLWALPPGERFPFGFGERFVGEQIDGSKARQRPRESGL